MQDTEQSQHWLNIIKKINHPKQTITMEKTEAQIKKIAESKYSTPKHVSLKQSNKTMCRRAAFIEGYIECQKYFDSFMKKEKEKIILNCVKNLLN